jgi:ribosomal protein L11 methyltransferase
MDFIEVEIKCLEYFREILMADLSEWDYNMFLETDNGFLAYIEQEKYSSKVLENALNNYLEPSQMTYSASPVKEKNWNEEWEKNYEPVVIEDKCLIRASFHKIDEKYPYEVVINPRMSFGTGHHETTWLMGSHQLEIDHKDKDVLDIGCGTGILAILAAKLGATSVTAIDNNDWAFSNAVDNVAINGLENVDVLLGSVDDIGIAKTFDLILANINRNVLLKELPDYVKMLREKGGILISGFYEEDEADMINLMFILDFQMVSRKTRNRWCALYFIRK